MMERNSKNSKNELINLNFEVDSIIFQNAKNGYAVLNCVLPNNENIFATGTLYGIDIGQKLNAKGFFVYHKFYGKQFQVESFKQSLPDTELAIRKFLSSGVLKGVGPVLCDRIVNRFKSETLNIIEHEPKQLLEIKGFSKNLLENLKQNLNNLFAMKRLLMFLETFNLKSVYGLKSWTKWGLFAIEKIKNNPFVLCSEGIDLPFFEADLIAKKLNFKSNDSARIESAIKFVLKHNANENGHTCAPRSNTVKIASNLLKLEPSDIETELGQIIIKKQLFCCEFNEKKFLFLPHFFIAENFIAQKIIDLAHFKQPINEQTFDNLIEIEQQNLSFELVEKQKQAVFQAISNGVFILTGGPGTGKTTVLKAVVSILEQRGLDVAVCAPTGRAAKRLFELTGKKATTIHRLLGVFGNSLGELNENVEFIHNQTNVLKHDVIIIDEMSMVDCLLFYGVLKAMKPNCRLILTGDYNQLPSVYAGNVLKNLIDSKKIPSIKLTEIFRQAAKSLIVQNAHAIINNKMPVLNKKDNNFFFINESVPQKIVQLVVDLATNRLTKKFSYSPIFDIQVIGLFKKGVVGTINLNKMLQEKINPKHQNKPEFNFGFYTYRQGDKVMQIKNDYEIKWRKNGQTGEGIFNGDIGIIVKIKLADQTFTVDFDGKLATYEFNQAGEIELAYAVTVHKSQGNEFKCVVLPVLFKPTEFFSRNLLYTAITRAKLNIILIGTQNSVKFMCNQTKVNLRYSGLKQFLKLQENPNEV